MSGYRASFEKGNADAEPVDFGRRLPLSARYLNGRTAFAITAGLFVWLIYVGLVELEPQGVQYANAASQAAIFVSENELIVRYHA